MFKYFWLHSKSFARLKVKLSLLTMVKPFECVQNIFTKVKKIVPGQKKIEHGQNVFELTDGLGIYTPKCCLSKISNAYTTKPYLYHQLARNNYSTYNYHSHPNSCAIFWSFS